MSAPRRLVAPAIAAGLVLLLIAVLYAADPARNLPDFLPGHLESSRHRHRDYSLLTAALATACFLLAWLAARQDRR